MKWFGLFSLSSKLLVGVILIFVLWQAWVFSRPRAREYSAVELQAIAETCGQFADTLRSAVRDSSDRRASGAAAPLRIGVAHLLDDPSDRVTESLKATLSAQPAWSVDESSVILKFLADISRAVADATTLDEIVRAGRRVELDIVVGGRVLAVEARGDGAYASLDLRAYDVRSGRWLLIGPVSAEWQPGAMSEAMAGIRKTRPILRFAIWLLLVALLPWLTPTATQRVMEKGSNASGFLLLTAYTAVDLLAAMVLSGFSTVGAGGSLRLLGAFLVCAGYNFWACEKIAARK